MSRKTSSGSASRSGKAALNPNRPLVRLAAPDPAQLAEGIIAGDRQALSRGITLCESLQRDHRAAALAVLDACWGKGSALRIGISGAPGVGKSSLLEALATRLADQGHRPAVLAIDPSSDRTGGSILGDKTRMPQLSRHPSAYVRPSPSSGVAGGIGRATRAAITLCEAAGYDLVFIETVGVGQGETAAEHMVDCFVLLALAGAGDELQGIKRGIVEVADLIAVTKADGANEDAAGQAASSVRNALSLFPGADSGWTPRVLTTSASTGHGVDELWTLIQAYNDHITASGFRKTLRARQAGRWLRDELQGRMLEVLLAEHGAALGLAEDAVRSGRQHPFRAADELFRRLSVADNAP